MLVSFPRSPHQKTARVVRVEHRLRRRQGKLPRPNHLAARVVQFDGDVPVTVGGQRAERKHAAAREHHVVGKRLHRVSVSLERTALEHRRLPMHFPPRLGHAPLDHFPGRGLPVQQEDRRLSRRGRVQEPVAAPAQPETRRLAVVVDGDPQVLPAPFRRHLVHRCQSDPVDTQGRGQQQPVACVNGMMQPVGHVQAVLLLRCSEHHDGRRRVVHDEGAARIRPSEPWHGAPVL